MGKRGPAPTPTKILELRGTRRRDREAPNVLEPKAGAPACPSWLKREVPWGTYARLRYGELAAELEQLGVLTEIDRDVLILYCDAYGRWRFWRQDLGKRGDWIQTSDKGWSAPSPAVTFMNQAMADMKRYGALLGLSPSDRRNVSAAPQEEKPADTGIFGRRGA